MVSEKLKKDIEISTRAKKAIDSEAKSAISQFMVKRCARLRSTSLVASAGRLLELLELPGHARLWSMGFRLMGWPLRQWLLGKRDEITHQPSDAVVRRILGNWKGKVWLSVFDNTFPSATEKPKINESWVDLKINGVDEFSVIVSKAAELEANLDMETNSAASEWLRSKPVTLGMARLLIAVFHAICVVREWWNTIVRLSSRFCRIGRHGSCDRSQDAALAHRTRFPAQVGKALPCSRHQAIF
jgi:hypothetical protein